MFFFVTPPQHCRHERRRLHMPARGGQNTTAIVSCCIRRGSRERRPSALRRPISNVSQQRPAALLVATLLWQTHRRPTVSIWHSVRLVGRDENESDAVDCRLLEVGVGEIAFFGRYEIFSAYRTDMYAVPRVFADSSKESGRIWLASRRRGRLCVALVWHHKIYCHNIH